MSETKETEVATFGAGCFWCVEAVFARVEGVAAVRPGYMGGRTTEPSYEEVCTGSTGHAEVVEVRFDRAVVSYETLCDWFFRAHDPTTKDRQGNDVGTQYRSVIFCHDAPQRATAERKIAELDAAEAFASPIVTEIAEADTFWPAEGYHDDYFRRNREQPYCRAVIAPKLGKLGLED